MTLAPEIGSPRLLSALAGTRDNNFNLIRFIAASLVLVSHGFALCAGAESAEPLFLSLGTTWGGIAVDIFFVTSGFLVTSSLLTRQRMIDFAAGRILRIYPGLLVANLLTLLVCGLLLSSLPWRGFFADAQTQAYLLLNSTLVGGVAFSLPGVFQSLPFKGAVNGSLWTMPWEIRMYLILLVGWGLVGGAVWLAAKLGLGKLLGRKVLNREKIFGGLVILLALAGMAAQLYIHFRGYGMDLVHFTAMFFTGGALFVVRPLVVVQRRIVLGCLAAILLSAVLQRDLFFVCYTLSIPYTVLSLAYCPEFLWRGFHRFGDYSYGIYIYAFPIQQMIVAAMPGIEPLPQILLAFPITLLFAVASWYGVEKRALGFKRWFKQG